MALTNAQFDKLKLIYDQKRERHLKEQNQRILEIDQKIPEYEDAEKKLQEYASLSIQYAISHSEAELSACQQRMRELREKRKRLLLDAGFPADYLELHYDCPDCKDSGFITLDNNTKKKCHCYQKLASQILLEDASKGDIPKTDTFDNFRFDYYSRDFVDDMTGLSAYDNAVQVVDFLKRYVSDFTTSENKNLLLYGNVGTGKTFLTHCIMNELKKINDQKKEGLVFFYVTAYELFEIAGKHTFSNEQTTERYDDILNSDLLIIDDLGSELVNSFTSSQIYNIINERIIRTRATIISTNLSLKEQREIYGERVSSRILGFYKLISMFGEDIRLKKLL